MKREKYLMDSLFLKFFNIWINKPGIWSKKFAAQVTKLLTPDEIRRLDGTYLYSMFKFQAAVPFNEFLFPVNGIKYAVCFMEIRRS
jgi:hypothetical protein